MTELSAWQPQVFGMQHLTSAMTTAAFKVELKTYFQELFVQHCEQQMLEQQYINVTIVVMVTLIA